MKSTSFALVAFITSLPAAQAATLTSLTVSTNNTSGRINLSTLGTTNWAAWDPRSASEVASITPTATMLSGQGTISAISATNGGTVRSTTETSIFPAAVDFTWSNGTVAPPSDEILTSVFHSTFETTDIGTRFSISSLTQLAAGQTYLIHVFTSSYRGTSTLTVSDGTNSLSLAGGTKGTTSHPDWYQFEYNPSSPADVLTISNILTTNGNGATSRSMIQGVAISVIPEPSAALLGGIGAVAAASLRRRSRIG